MFGWIAKLRRFVREAKAACALNHPHIATIHEVGLVGGIHYIATGHIGGKTLSAQMLGRRIAASDANMTLGTQSDDLSARLRLFFEKEVKLFKIRVIEIAAWVMLATFDSSARAIRAASAIRSAALRLNI